MKPISFIATLVVLFSSCSDSTQTASTNTKKENSDLEEKAPAIHLYRAYFPFVNEDSTTVIAIIEIPAGTTEKWEVDKHTGRIERDSIDGEPRSISYLGYPANYGFIPRTILPKSEGGDGDPLDVIVLGKSYERGDVLECEPIGVLKLLDNGERDDKIILVQTFFEFSDVTALNDLEENYPGVLEILETWFVNYKGPGQMKSEGFGDKNEALQLISEAASAYKFEVEMNSYTTQSPIKPTNPK